MPPFALPVGPLTACALRDVAKAVKHSSDAAAVAVQQGFVGRLVAILTPAAPAVDSKIRLWVLRTLWCLSLHVDAPHVSAAQPQILDCVLAALTGGTQDEEAYACLDAVRACIETTSGVVYFVVAGGIELLSKVLAHALCPPLVALRVLDCLAGLQHSGNCVSHLHLVIRAVYAAMITHRGSALVQTSAVQLLAAFARDNTVALLATHTAMDVVTVVRAAMDAHRSSKSLQQYGCVVLGRLPGLLHVAVVANLVIRATSLAPRSCGFVCDGCTALYTTMKSAPSARKLMQLVCENFVRGLLALHPTCSAVQAKGNKVLAYLSDGPVFAPVDLGSDTDAASDWDSEVDPGACVPAPLKRVCRK